MAEQIKLQFEVETHGDPHLPIAKDKGEEGRGGITLASWSQNSSNHVHVMHKVANMAKTRSEMSTNASLQHTEGGEKLSSPEVVNVGDLLHTKPAELGSTDSTSHMITRAIVHLDYQSSTSRTCLYVTYATYTDVTLDYYVISIYQQAVMPQLNAAHCK